MAVVYRTMYKTQHWCKNILKKTSGGNIMEAGVRNRLSGTITEITTGEVMSQVTARMGDHEITSVMTRESLEEAGFKQGDNVTALIKAINVVFVK
jgi:molybdate transport system regulatory protein